MFSVYGIESLKYILQLRGVFQTYRTREKPNSGGLLDEKGKETIRQMLDVVKPWMKA